MADPVTMADLALQTKELSDIRREANSLAATTVQTAATTAADLSKQIDAIDDTLTAAIHQVSRDGVDNKVQITGLGYQVRDGFYAAGKDAEINALKTQIETAKQTTYLSDKIGDDGEKTRALIAGLNNTDLNRELIERNALLSEARFDGRHWRDRADMGQYAALNTQLQAFASQLQDVKQGTVNFGTMSGNAGRNQATNNVA
jgi:hypothetical protein